ncbi:hypothetical protein MKK75_01075 [Methylobacterium sp. J-030]|uniref:hypothetical protein n=1 Tax=Methylobacterium sp. J-030 TaxID=2836627 RepID=UPI001FBB5E35|nr:hypothetical protein [Methylobacterium sp. J-030]MCJ2067408.1 hypothetical protein [Methylobacterium sp. J-030]
MSDTLFFRIAAVADGRAPQRIRVLPHAGGLVLVGADQSRSRIVITEAEAVTGQGDELDGPAYRLECGSLSVRVPRFVVDYLLQDSSLFY